MIYDIHAHVIGISTPVPKRGRLLLRFLARRWGIQSSDLDSRDARRAAQQRITEWLKRSKLDRAVFLALDAPYDREGRMVENGESLLISNDDVAALASESRKALFAASVHPWRKDAVAELERVIRKGACLIKWLPAAQNICPDDPACFHFYEALAHYHIPLLSHSGNEHTFRGFDHSYNYPRRLEAALKMGVTVIAAHCGARLYLHEQCFFNEWSALAERYENCFGDISAFCVPTRASHLRRILDSRLLTSKILYGSDFPAPAMPLGHVFQLGFKNACNIRRIDNPFDRPAVMMRALGVPEEVFSRAASILRQEASVA